MVEMDKEKGLSNGQFSFRHLPDGSLDKTKAICNLLSMWTELPQEYVEFQIPLAGQAHKWCRDSPPPSPKADHADSLQWWRLDNSTWDKL